MKTVKSLLLGSAAGLVAITGAQAADLPLAEPVDYVRICDTWGNGFHYIPGTNTCLLIGGRVRAQVNYQQQHHSYNRDANLRLSTVPTVGAPGTSFEGEIVGTGINPLGGGLGVIAPDGVIPGGTNSLGRTRDLVTLTSPSVRVWFDARTQTEYGTLRSYIRINGAGGGGLDYNQAFIQFAGLTMGRALSPFDADYYTTYTTFGSEQQSNQFAYTATFGNGFSATVGIEDRNDRRISNYGAGRSMPNVVGNLKVAQGWGQAQLSGAFQQLRHGGVAGLNGNRDFPGTTYGWAVQGAVRVNLPALGSGDYIYVSAAYADGALGYLGGNANAWNTFNGLLLTDAVVVDDVAGNLSFKKSKGYSIHGGLRHFWTSALRSNLNVGYDKVNQYGTTLDYSQWTVAFNTVYSPVQNLDFGLEVFYRNLSAKNVNRAFYGLQPVDTKDSFGATFRVERRF